jgi:SAM-dependent methyltransferase
MGMTPDVKRLISFYKSPLGRISRSLVREQIRALAGDVKGLRVLGLGFATPYLRFTLKDAERVLAFMPARQGASSWPREGPSHTVLCDPLEMPLTDSAVDLIIAVHAFEYAADAEELMREIWRVSAPNARLIVVVPRRRGLWAQRDNTPYGAGNPFSKPQLDNLLRTHSFTPEAWRDALYLPPSNSPFILKSARLFEGGGRLLGPTLSGVMCVKAKKELFPAIARRQKAVRFVRVPDLAPQTAMQGPNFRAFPE